MFHLRKTALDDGKHDCLGSCIDVTSVNLNVDFLHKIKHQRQAGSNILEYLGRISYFFLKGVESSDDFGPEIDELDNRRDETNHSKRLCHLVRCDWLVRNIVCV